MFATPRIVKRATPEIGALAPIPVPLGGINARDPISAMPPTDAIDLINCIVDGFGISVRGGYQEFATDLPGATPVRTVMSYYPPTAVGSAVISQHAKSPYTFIRTFSANRALPTVSGRLFACTNLNIYDITLGGAGPWVAELGVNVTSDYWTWRNFQNAGGNFLLAVNDEGGYYAYGGAGFDSGFSSGFAIASTGFIHIVEGPSPTQIQNVNPDLFEFMMVWKRRLWFIEANSSRAWYLPVEQLTGDAHRFDFGPQFRHGGHLVALANWTIDGGEGIDDYLIAVGSEGDVVVYKGYDPDSADVDPNAFQLHGIWYVGPLPHGRRQVTPWGGDVYILSMFGVTQISKLVTITTLGPDFEKKVTGKIDSLISEYMQNYHTNDGWYLKMIPSLEIFAIGAPERVSGEGPQQFIYKIPQMAWSRFNDLPVGTFTNHDALIFGGGQNIGTSIVGDGKVFLMFDTQLDNVSLTDADQAQRVKVRIIPAYNPLGSPGLNKIFTMLRATVLRQANIEFKITVLTNYQLPGFSNIPTLPIVSGALWNVDLWNVGKWSGAPTAFTVWLGTVGEGYAATPQIDMNALAGTKLTSLAWWTVAGGVL